MIFESDAMTVALLVNLSHVLELKFGGEFELLKFVS